MRPRFLPRSGFSLLLTAWSAALVLTACTKPEPEKPAALPTVAGEVVSFPGNQDPAALRVAAVESSADRAVQLSGRLGWNEDRTARVYAPYAGRVDQLLVAVGQTVARGQALARLSSADVGQAQADQHKAEADQLLARQAVTRVRELHEAGVVARKDLEQAEADLARAGAEAARAKARLAQYGLAAGGTGGTGGTGAAVGLGYTLAAPLAGVVVERNSNPGAEVRTDVQGPPLFTISDPATLWATIDLDETQLALVRPGQVLGLSAAAWPDRTFEAKVLSVGAAVDPASRTVKLRAQVDNPERLLKAEMFVTARLANPSGLPLVPSDAVFLRGERQAVFVALGKGRYERREVQLRAAGPERWAVVKGLAAGEKVVVGGALFLNQQLDTSR